MAGRPTKLTTELMNEIAQYLRAGNYIETTAALVGINRDSIYEWIKRGNRVREEWDTKMLTAGENNNDSLAVVEEVEIVDLYLEFSEAVKKARAEAEGANIRNIRRASDNGVWQASAWWLERSFPKKWGKRSSGEIGGENGEPIKFEISYGD